MKRNLGRWQNHNPRVGGSSPSSATNLFNGLDKSCLTHFPFGVTHGVTEMMFLSGITPPLVEEGLSYGGYGLHLKPAIFAILIMSGIGAI